MCVAHALFRRSRRSRRDSIGPSKPASAVEVCAARETPDIAASAVSRFEPCARAKAFTELTSVLISLMIDETIITKKAGNLKSEI